MWVRLLLFHAYDARPTELWHTLEQTAERVLHTQQCVRRTMKMFGTWGRRWEGRRRNADRLHHLRKEKNTSSLIFFWIWNKASPFHLLKRRTLWGGTVCISSSFLSNAYSFKSLRGIKEDQGPATDKNGFLLLDRWTWTIIFVLNAEIHVWAEKAVQFTLFLVIII